MSDAYHFSGRDVKRIGKSVRRTEGGHTSQKPIPRRRGMGGGGDGGFAHGILVKSLGAGSVDGTAKEITPSIVDAAAYLVKWSDDGTKLEADGGAIKAANGKQTGLRASTSEPIEVWGTVDTVNGEKVFRVMTPEVILGNPDYEKGSEPSGNDDPDLQTLHHKGGSEEERLGSEQC